MHAQASRVSGCLNDSPMLAASPLSRAYTGPVNAEPFLAEVARHLEELHFDVVLIGNAAAALHGAPVTTVDFDFMFRQTPVNRRKLKELAGRLGAVVLRPYYPASDLFRVVRDDDGLQLDFLGTIHGISSFASLKARAQPVRIGSANLLVAALADVIRSKAAAGRPRDRAILEVLERTHAEAKRAKEQAGRPQARKRTRPR
jgi:predicted nucleotidyltransferase